MNCWIMFVQETEKYKQSIVGYFKQYVDWVKTSVSIQIYEEGVMWSGWYVNL